MNNPLFERSKTKGMFPRVTVDARGFVRVGGVKIGRYIPERHALEFKDHGKGGRIVEIRIAELVGGIRKAPG